MGCMFVLLSVLLGLTAAVDTDSAAPAVGPQQASPCPAQWSLFGDRCFAFYPVWSTWSSAESVCSQEGRNLASLHSPAERRFVQQLIDRHTDGPVWLGGYLAPQGNYWFWSDGSPFSYNTWANERPRKTREGGTCMEMNSKDEELNEESCGELRFYICSTRASHSLKASLHPNRPSGLVPGVSMFDLLWSYSERVAEEILHTSFIRAVRSGVSAACYTSYSQQEAVYLHRLSTTLQVVGSIQPPDDITQLLHDTLTYYRNIWVGYQNVSSMVPSLPVRQSLQSFHSVVLEDCVYWLVVLSARARLLSYLARELSTATGHGSDSDPRLLFRPESPGAPEADIHSKIKRSDPEASQGLFSRVGPDSEPRARRKLNSRPRLQATGLSQQWVRDNLMEEVWADRYRSAIDRHQDQLEVYKAVNLFRIHMMNQKTLFRAL